MEEYCKNCGALLKEGAKFCQECGNPIEIPEETVEPETDKQNEEITNIEKQNICPNCGRKSAADEDFCSDCGTNLKNPEIPTSQPAQESFINKYKIPIAIVCVVAIILLAWIAIGSMANSDVGTQNVEVGSTNFEIPGDYEIDPSTIDVDYADGSAVFTKAWINPAGDLIYISTMTVPYGLDSESMISANGGELKTMLGGYEGYYVEKDGVYSFSFETGGYVCLVGTSNPHTMDEISCLG